MEIISFFFCFFFLKGQQEMGHPYLHGASRKISLLLQLFKRAGKAGSPVPTGANFFWKSKWGGVWCNPYVDL